MTTPPDASPPTRTPALCYLATPRKPCAQAPDPNRTPLHDHLFALGFIEARIKSNLGYWSHHTQDVCRWEGVAFSLATSRTVSLHSWDSIPDCAKRGVTVEYDNTGFEVFAKPKKRSRMLQLLANHDATRTTDPTSTTPDLR